MSAKPIVYILTMRMAVRTSLATLLDIHGFSTRVYAVRQSVPERRGSRSSGCALVDVKMPGLDGIGLLQKMAEGNIRVPVVIMTGYGEVATAVTAMKAGAVDFLEKPLDEGELLAILNRLLFHSQERSSSRSGREQARARCSG